ncbi:MAG: S41 family peptidase [Bacteroidales bacterium]|nr:S41 family peptidase [Bacteroidales bacterium]
MKLNRLIMILAAAAIAVSCADADKTFVRKAVRLMDKNGLFAEGPQWESARAEALAASPSSPEEARQLVETALKVAGGKHSFLQSAQSVQQDATSEWATPSVSFQEDGIPVITLPRFSGNSDEGLKYANAVLEALPETLPGVVIDLRGNTGGNMYPMIAAVQRFLPDGDVIRFRTRKRTQWIPLDYVLSTVGVQRLSRIECPVAILTDEMTASSGEAVLIGFRGLDDVRVFGAPTAGYASANTPFPLPDGSNLVLTTGCDVARTGEAFCDDPIVPDVPSDDPLAAALAWLR